MAAKRTRAEFIANARAKHGDKYDYSKVVYVNCQTKVTIICPVHQEFEQRPTHHTTGNGCIPCARENRVKALSYNTEEFIAKAKAKHGDKYDYSKVDYHNQYTKVIIICPDHKEFPMRPHAHWVGQGCPACKGEHLSKLFCSNTEEFIAKAKAKHGDKYDYSKVDYKRNNVKVVIVCPKHGEFEQCPQDHLRPNGCWDCRNEAISVRKSSNTEEFIAKAKAKHGDTYDYSKVDYQNNYTYVTIICPEHKEWLQTPGNHLMGAGCPGCAEFGFDQLKPACVYQIRFVTEDHGLFYKCGVTNNKPELRTTQIKTSYKNAYTTPQEVTIIDVINFDLGSAAWKFEQKLKDSEHKLENHFVRPFSGSTETYNTGVLVYWDELKAEVAEDRRV